MKKKLILPTLLATSSCVLLPLVSCANKYEMSELTKDILSEMIGSQDGEQILGTCSVPHPSHHCHEIAEYLKDKIHQIDSQTIVPIDDHNNLWCDIQPNNPQNNIYIYLLEKKRNLTITPIFSAQPPQIRPCFNISINYCILII